MEPKSIENLHDIHLYTSECKSLWGEPEEVPSFANVAHMYALHGSKLHENWLTEFILTKRRTRHLVCR